MSRGKRFENKVVIVTGGASGIGLATALRFASEGAIVVVADIDEKAIATANEKLMAAGVADVLPSVCNVADENQVAATMSETVGRFGSIDVVVNNAGLMVFKPIEEQTTEDWQRILGVDLLGAFYFIRESFLRMRPGGAIVNVSSIHAEETTPLVAPYAAAKAALLSLTRSAALEGSAKGICINAILPGAVDTPMLWENPNIVSGVEKVDPAFVGRPEEVSAAIAFLASSDASFIQGAALRVDGGRLTRL